MTPIRQRFPAGSPLDLRAELQRELARLRDLIKPGARLAVAVGSRGIANLAAIVGATVGELQAAGAQPFIVPAMGSHGGATPEGQLQLLAEYGVTEPALGVPIRAGMEVERLGATADGVDVFFSREALRSDGVVVINRVKPHTDFHSDTIGSGLLKMLVVGLGKQPGAANFHILSSRFGYEQVLRSAARITLGAAPILGGVAIIENQRHETARLQVLLPGEMEAREPALFAEARRLMPRLPFDDIDLLIVDFIGKNISGSGMDPNIIGRSLHGYSALLGDRSTNPVIRRIFVRELTPETHGNVVGVGLADFTTTRLVKAMDHQVTYLNALTALSLQSVKIPIHFDTDREAIARALDTLALPDTSTAKVMRVRHTLDLERLEISDSFTRQLGERPDLEAGGPATEMRFDPTGNLRPLD